MLVRNLELYDQLKQAPTFFLTVCQLLEEIVEVEGGNNIHFPSPPTFYIIELRGRQYLQVFV